MKLYITRHGQVASARSSDFIGGDFRYPAGEIPLSPLGQNQARLTGERLRSLGFRGRILSSPFLRTMETAEIIARVLDAPIYPFGPIHEIIRTDEGAQNYRGSSIDFLRAHFSHVAPDALLPAVWWAQHGEDGDAVRARVQAGLDSLTLTGEDDILFVGHGASTYALVRCLNIPRVKGAAGYNCALSAISFDEEGFRPMYFDSSHLPYEETTNNFRTREECEREAMRAVWEREIVLPDGLAEEAGGRILHIGDTPSWDYPYYRALIAAVKPDVIVHTGDMADEVKVGRIPAVRAEYMVKLEEMLEILHESGARVILTPGNNDLPQEMARLAPWAEQIPENTRMEILGADCRVGHRIFRMERDAQNLLYGHGLTGETWKYEWNRPGERCRFNAVWGSFVLCPASGRYYRIVR